MAIEWPLWPTGEMSLEQQDGARMGLSLASQLADGDSIEVVATVFQVNNRSLNIAAASHLCASSLKIVTSYLASGSYHLVPGSRCQK